MAQRTLEIIVNSSGSAAKGIDSLTDSLGKVEPAAKKAQGGIGGLSGGLSDLADSFGLPLSPAALATAGIAAMGAAVVTSVNAAREGRAVQAQLASVLESTGHAAGISQAALNEHAEALQDLTNFDDEAVGSAQALLLTFTKIGGSVIPEATETVLDMSTALGQDLKSSSVQVGKALNDPINGITALSRVGVTFSAEQKDMIRSMVEMGDVAGAQGVILKELNTEFGGSAEAAREADGGFIAVGNSLGNLSEGFGEVVLNVLEATRAMDGILSLLGSMTETANATAAAFDQGIGQGLLTIFDNANPVTQVLEKLGIDIIPTFAAAASESVGAINSQAEAHLSAAGAASEQESAIQSLSLNQVESLSDLGKLEEDYNAKKEQLLDSRLTAETDAAGATAKNQQELNQKLNELNLQQGQMTAEQLTAKKQKLIENYNEENNEIRTKLQERQQAIDEQLAKEKAQYEEKAQELKLVMAAQALEQSGQLEELTGIAGITAEQYVQAVKYGAIEANREVENEMRNIVQNFEGASRDQESIAKTNAESIKRVLGESASGSASSWKQATNSIVSDFERQALAAYKAAQASGGSVNYSSNKKNTNWGPGFASGGTFTVPPGYPNDSFPMWVESGEKVSVIPRDQADRMPKFARGTGIPAGWKLDETGLGYVPPDYQPGSTWDGNKWVAPKKNNIYVKPGGGRFSKMTGRQLLDARKKDLGGSSSASASSAAASSASSMASTASAAPVASTAPRSTGGMGGGPVYITIQYNPTVSLANQYELVQALKPAWEELARLYGVSVNP
jgi:hypothetical protein